MRAGINTKYSHTGEELIREAVLMPEFSHLDRRTLADAIRDECWSKNASVVVSYGTEKEWKGWRKRIALDPDVAWRRKECLKDHRETGWEPEVQMQISEPHYEPEVPLWTWEHGLTCRVCTKVWDVRKKIQELERWQPRHEPIHTYMRTTEFQSSLVGYRGAFDGIPAICPDCAYSLNSFVWRHRFEGSYEEQSEMNDSATIGWLAKYVKKAVRDYKRNGCVTVTP